jgi:cation diffusion facilitator CzcD-associated flavoprotein CzcO
MPSPPPRSPPQPDYDVIIIGAGLSGIGAAYYMKHRTSLSPVSFCVLESRAITGGTWSFFNYPGFRNDSTMFTFAYPWHPWTKEEHIVDGKRINEYLDDVLDKHDLRQHVQLNQRVDNCAFDSDTNLWTLTTSTSTITARFIIPCSGYYSYTNPYTPAFPGYDAFKGLAVHAQNYPKGLSFENKRVTVIGSGATAITMVPALIAGNAKSVTMIQRSPSFIVPLPAKDNFKSLLPRLLGPLVGGPHVVCRWMHLTQSYFFYYLCVSFPTVMKATIVGWSKAIIRKFKKKNEPPHNPAYPNFYPSYNPWEQRLCLCPDFDFYKAAADPRMTIATGHIDKFTPDGVLLKSSDSCPNPEVIESDMVIVATGLTLLPVGGISLTMDGKPVEITGTMLYKGFAPDGIPNCALAVGYLNSSWTLKADLTFNYVTRLLDHMKKTGTDVFVAKSKPSDKVGQKPLLGFKSGYIERANGKIPMQGKASPWKLHQSYFSDIWETKWKRVDDGVMTFASSSGGRWGEDKKKR